VPENKRPLRSSSHGFGTRAPTIEWIDYSFFRKRSRNTVKYVKKWSRSGIIVMALLLLSGRHFAVQQPRQQKPNILFIMGDDIGWMKPSIYQEGLMVGKTPNIARSGQGGPKFMDYMAMPSCPSGRNAFFTGMSPLRRGMIPPQLPGSPSWLRP